MAHVQAHIKAGRDVLIEHREPFTTNCVEPGADSTASGPRPSHQLRSPTADGLGLNFCARRKNDPAVGVAGPMGRMLMRQYSIREIGQTYALCGGNPALLVNILDGDAIVATHVLLKFGCPSHCVHLVWF